MRLLLLLLLLTSAYAVLDHSFCAELRDVGITSAGAPQDVLFELSDICLTFVNSSNHVLTLSGYYSKAGGTQIPTTAWCSGTYSFAAPQEINFAYDLSDFFFCTSTTSGYSFCNWACALFGGSFTPYFDQAAAPMRLTVSPFDPLANPPLNWGNLQFSFPMFCNNTSCGSAENLIPNVQSSSGTNASFIVRRSLIIWERLIGASHRHPIGIE